MASYTVSTEIHAPPEVVYDYVADLARHGDWSSDPLEVVPVAGDLWRSTARSKGKTIDAELQVLERHPPERFVFDAVDLTGRWRHTFTFKPVTGGTHVTRAIDGSLSGSQLFLYWLVVLPIKKPNAARAVRRLKEVVEHFLRTGEP